MQDDHQFEHMPLASKTSEPSIDKSASTSATVPSVEKSAHAKATVSRWTPHPLDLRSGTGNTDSRSLNELSVDLQVLSRRTHTILQSLNPSGSPEEQLLFELTRILEQEQAELLSIAQALQSE